MTTIQDIINYVEAGTGHKLNRDEGLQHGPLAREVHGVTVAWMATPNAIAAAGRSGHELLIGHESLYYPYDVVNSDAPPEDWQSWRTNRQRREALDAHDLSFLRIHGSVDELTIFDTFADVLGLGQPAFAEGLVKVYEIQPCTVQALIDRVKACTGMAHLRVAPAGKLDQVVHRVGLPWGGLGLFVNVGYVQKLIAQGCDVFIAGESDNYGFRFAAECGIPMIETSHEISENPGLRRFTAQLSSAFPDVTFEFYHNRCIWEMV